MNIKILKAQLHHLDEILNLFKNTISISCQNDYKLDQLRVWKSSINNINNWKNAIKTEYFLIALIQNKIVGFGSLKGQTHINSLYVHPDYLRKGIAKSIFDELKKEFQKLGSQNISADVSKTALPFFKKQGFKIVKENKNVIDGIEILNYKMILLLF